MDYESYYEDLNNGYPEQKPPRRSGRIALTVIIFSVVFFICGLLVAGLIQSAQQPNVPFFTPRVRDFATPAPEDATKPSVPTPLPTDRPMITLDGVAPDLSDAINPIPDIVDAVAPSVVGVISYSQYDDHDIVEMGMGSGFFISSDGYVLTNAHVVEGAAAISITLMNGKELDAELIAKDSIGDVAVLRVENAGVAPLKLGNSENIRVGEYVVAVGNPMGRNYEGTVTMGIISARSRAVTIEAQTNTYIQTDAAINLGNSGGPLLNLKGEVIGINTAKTTVAGYDEYGMQINAEGISFALPMNKVMIIVEQLITKGFVQRAALGVHIRSITRQEMLEIDVDHGILVVSVVRDSPADRSGLLADDIILFYDGMSAEKQDILVDYVSSLPVGSRMELVILREGEEQTVMVDLVDSSSLDYDDVSK